jgi:diacylglycerol O-acyltransferase
MMERWTQLTPPKPFAAFMRTYSRLRLANHHPPPINLVVSNVPGPREELEIAGAKLVDLFSVGPVLEGIGLNITVWSYLDRMNFAGIACPDSLPDLRGILDRLEPALAELLAAAPGTPKATAATAS